MADFLLIYQGGDPSWRERPAKEIEAAGPRRRVSTEMRRRDSHRNSVSIGVGMASCMEPAAQDCLRPS